MNEIDAAHIMSGLWPSCRVIRLLRPPSFILAWRCCSTSRPTTWLHKSHKNYALAKIKLFENMVDDDLVVIDVEDAGIHEFDEYIYMPGRRICKVAFDEPEGADAAFVRDGKLVVR